MSKEIKSCCSSGSGESTNDTGTCACASKEPLQEITSSKSACACASKEPLQEITSSSTCACASTKPAGGEQGGELKSCCAPSGTLGGLDKLGEFFEHLASVRMTMVSAFLLVLSFLMLFEYIWLPIDPAWGVIFISGLPLMYAALVSIVNDRKIRASLLISIAMIASIAIGEIFAAGEVAFIMALGGILEDKTIARAKRGLQNLIALSPQQGRRVQGEKEEIVPIEQIVKDDTLRILPGETIPVDGIVLTGNSSVDQAIMTGESLPVDKAEGDTVFCGTINRFGAIDIRATKVGEDSSLQKLIKMVQDAERNQAPMQRIVDVWASRLVPAALLIAVVVYLATGDIIRGVTVLVVFCPCALALATPTSIVAAIGQATKHGVIIKSGEALENMGKVDSIALDKTGTLTLGNLQVSNIIPFNEGMSPERLLQVCASVESRSEHPLGKAVMVKASADKTALLSISDFTMQPGKGVEAKVEDKLVLCGTVSHLQEKGINIDAKALENLEAMRKEGKASIMVGMDGECIGMLALSDTLRPEVKEMVDDLHAIGTEVVLLTGDHAQTADYFAKQVGIDNVYAELLPEQKVERIKALQNQGQVVCMVGDGVNDAPSLKIAQVGVAMGAAGSDIAIEAADVALMSDDIKRLPYLKKLSLATLGTIKFNLAMSLIINFGAIGCAAMGWLTPITGALVHNAGSVLVVLNAALLYDRKIK